MSSKEIIEIMSDSDSEAPPPPPPARHLPPPAPPAPHLPPPARHLPPPAPPAMYDLAEDSDDVATIHPDEPHMSRQVDLGITKHDSSGGGSLRVQQLLRQGDVSPPPKKKAKCLDEMDIYCDEDEEIESRITKHMSSGGGLQEHQKLRQYESINSAVDQSAFACPEFQPLIGITSSLSPLPPVSEITVTSNQNATSTDFNTATTRTISSPPRPHPSLLSIVHNLQRTRQEGNNTSTNELLSVEEDRLLPVILREMCLFENTVSSVNRRWDSILGVTRFPGIPGKIDRLVRQYNQKQGKLVYEFDPEDNCVNCLRCQGRVEHSELKNGSYEASFLMHVTPTLERHASLRCVSSCPTCLETYKDFFKFWTEKGKSPGEIAKKWGEHFLQCGGKPEINSKGFMANFHSLKKYYDEEGRWEIRKADVDGAFLVSKERGDELKALKIWINNRRGEKKRREMPNNHRRLLFNAFGGEGKGGWYEHERMKDALPKKLD